MSSIVTLIWLWRLLADSLKVSFSLRAEYERNTVKSLGYQRKLMAVALLYKL